MPTHSSKLHLPIRDHHKAEKAARDATAVKTGADRAWCETEKDKGRDQGRTNASGGGPTTTKLEGRPGIYLTGCCIFEDRSKRREGRGSRTAAEGRGRDGNKTEDGRLTAETDHKARRTIIDEKRGKVYVRAENGALFSTFDLQSQALHPRCLVLPSSRRSAHFNLYTGTGVAPFPTSPRIQNIIDHE